MRNKYAHAPADVPQTQAHRQSLRQPCGYAGSLDAHTQPEDEHDIKQNIGDSRRNEKIKGLARIAKSTNLSRKEVETERERDGGKLQHKEDIGIVEYLVGSVHKLQYAPTEHQRQQRHNCRHHHRHAHRIVNIRPHLSEVLGTESLCHRYGETGTRPVAETHDEKHHRRRCTHRRQSLHTDPAPYYRRINDKIHLLQDISKNERQRKPCYATHGRTRRHVVHRPTRTLFLFHIFLLRYPKPARLRRSRFSPSHTMKNAHR